MRPLRFWPLVFIAVALLTARASAAGLAGRVVFGDLPVPGATVTASKGDRQVTTVTDEQGAFTFADLDNGAWTVRVEMSTFVTLIARGDDSGRRATRPGADAEAARGVDGVPPVGSRRADGDRGCAGRATGGGERAAPGRARLIHHGDVHDATSTTTASAARSSGGGHCLRPTRTTAS